MMMIFLKNIPFQFLDMSKSLIYIMLFVLVFFSCASPQKSDYEKINNYLRTVHNYHELQLYKNIVVINESGTCMNCNNSFSKSMTKNIENDNVLFLICSPGRKVDISGYLDTEKSNILFDFHNKFGKLNLVNHCAIIKLEDKKIDTIIEIDVNNVREKNTIIFPTKLGD